MNKIAQNLSGLVAAGFLLLSTSTTTHAQEVCAPRDHALGQLEKRHHEKILGRGLTPNGKAMFELFVSKSGSWTVLVSHTNGRSCFVAAGDSWHPVKPLPAGSV